MITGKETTVGVVAPAGAVGASEVITAIDIFNYVIFGVTVGGWLQVAAIITVIIVLVLNGIKLYKAVKELLHKDKNEEEVF